MLVNDESSFTSKGTVLVRTLCQIITWKYPQLNNPFGFNTKGMTKCKGPHHDFHDLRPHDFHDFTTCDRSRNRIYSAKIQFLDRSQVVKS
jgi:hypothetical protein